MTADHVISVDQGTSSTKTLLLDGDGRIVAEAGRPMATAHPEAGWVEQDPGGDASECRRLRAAELLEKSAVTPASIAGLGIDNHTETLVLWDQESGARFTRPSSGSAAQHGGDRGRR